MLVQTPYGLGEVVFKGDALAKVRIPSYLPKTVKSEDNPEREYWFWVSELDTFPSKG
jgi:hypothetical protein